MAITRVQTPTKQVTDNATSVSKAFASNVTAGNRIIVTVVKYDPENDPFVLADVSKSAGTCTVGTWTMDASQIREYVTGEFMAVAIYSAQVTGTGSCTITVGGATAGSYWVLGIIERSGIDTTSPIEDTAVGQGASASATTATADSAGAAIFVGAVAVEPDNVVTITPGTDYTEIVEEENGSLHMTGASEDRIVTGATTDTADWTFNKTVDWAAVVVVYKEASSGGASGSLASTLGALTVAGAGNVAIAGALAVTLGALTAVGVGNIPISGALTQTLGALTVAGVGNVAVSGALTTTLGAATLTSTGVVGDAPIVGTLAQTLAPATLAGAGNVPISGALVRTLGTLTGAGVGNIPVQGALVRTLGDVTLAGVGGSLVQGSLAQTLGPLTVAGTGGITIVGSLTRTLGAVTLAGSGLTVARTGSLARTLGALTLNGSGIVITFVPITTLSSFAVLMELSPGVFTDKTTDVRLEPISFGYGGRDYGPTGHVADTGVLTFVLNNINAAGVVGRYSIGHANCIAGFDLGTRVKITMSFLGQTYYKFIGTIDRATPVSGPEDFTVTVNVVDWMDDAARHEIKGVPVQVKTNIPAVLTALLAASPSQPFATDIPAAAPDTLAYAPAAGPDELYSLASEFQRLMQSDGGLLTMRGGTNIALHPNRLTYISRDRLVQAPYNVAQAALDNSMLTVEADVARESALTVFKMTTHPRRPDTAPVILYEHGEKTPIDPGASLSFTASYVDPLQTATQVAGFGMIQPVNGTDIKINSDPSGTGTDLYANFSVSVAYGFNTVTYTFTNNGATTGYLATLRARGYGLYDYDAIEVEVRDAAAVTLYGANPVSLDLFYQSDPTFAKNMAAYLLPYFKDADMTPVSVSFFAGADTARMLAALAVEPGDAIGPLKEATTGLDTYVRVLSVDYQIIENKHLFCTWGLSPVVDRTDYWILEEPGSSLGVNTVVAL